MIVRIVKMTFKPEEVGTFEGLFKESKSHIRNFPGVIYLELLRDKSQSNIFFTYSYWENETDLESYRHSNLFKTVWSKTKPLFSEPAKAWSTDRLYQLK